MLIITSKSAGAALGLNQYKSPDDLVRQLVRSYHNVESEFKGNMASEYGKLHEPLAIMDYEMETEENIIECSTMFHPKYNWLSSSPIAFSGKDKVLNIKCPFGLRNKKKPEFKKAKEQEKYYAEMQIDMAITGKNECDFYQWSINGNCIERVLFDEEWFNNAIIDLESFYKWALAQIDNHEHLEDKVKEVNILKADELIKENDKLNTIIDDSKARISEILIELVDICKNRDSIVCGRKLTEVERAGSISYSKVVKDNLKGIDLEKYRGKPSKYWKLS